MGRLSRTLAAAMALAVFAAAAQDAADSARQLERLRSRIEGVNEALEQDRSRRNELRGQLQVAEKRVASLLAELKKLRGEIAEQGAELRKTEQQHGELDGRLRRERASLARQVRAAYVIGQRGHTKLLLNQDRSQRLSRVLTYYDYLNRARAEKIRDIAQQAAAVEALLQQLQVGTAELEATRNRRQGTLTALEAARGERGQTLKRLAARIEGGEGELAQLRSDERELLRLMDELRSVLADVPVNLGAKPFAGLKGRLPWPHQGRLLARFGNPKAGGALKWNGLWIGGREGDPVKAVAAGRVAYVGWMHRYGLIAVLEHEGNYYSLYGHNLSVGVEVGDWVQSGDVIAAVGATGGHEKNGLYFELRKGSDAINPGSWLRKG